MDGPAHSYATGDIVPAYPYLWRREKDRGEDAGRKGRPVCVAIAMKDSAGLTHLALLAITGSEPIGDQNAVELPALEIRRIGLRQHKSAWVIVSEYNYDILERSYALEPPRETPRKLSPGFLKVVLTAFRPVLADKRRTDRPTVKRIVAHERQGRVADRLGRPDTFPVAQAAAKCIGLNSARS